MEVNGVTQRVTTDNAATRSGVSSALVNPACIRRCNLSPLAANDEELQILGTCVLKLAGQGHEWQHEFLEGRVYFPRVEAPTGETVAAFTEEFRENVESLYRQHRSVRSKGRIMVKKGRDARIPIEIFPLPLDRPSLSTPRKVKQGGVVAWVVVLNPSDSTILVSNTTKKDIQIKKGMKLGFIFEEQPQTFSVEEKDWDRFLINMLEEEKKPQQAGRQLTAKDLDMGTSLKEEEKEMLLKLLNEKRDVFDEAGGPLRTTHLLKVRLPLRDPDKVIYQHNYVPNPVRDAAAAKVIQQMVKEEILEPAPHSNYRIPFMLVEKGVDPETKEMQVRMVLSANKLNETLARINYDPLQIPNVLAALKGKDMFSVINLSASFHQLEIDKRDRQVLTIQHRGRQYRYKKLPTGLSISSQYLCYALNLALGKILYKSAISYVDDTIVYSKGGFPAHLSALSEALDAFRDANFGINREKCRFAFKTISFLGYVLDGAEYRVDPSRFRAMEKLREYLPTSPITESLSEIFTRSASPSLKQRIQKKKIEWGEEQRLAVETLHKALLKNATLLHFDPKRPTVVSCDGSPVFGVGAVLFQKCPKSQKFKPVSLFSKQFTKSQRKMSAHDAELLAVLYTIRRWHSELHAVPFFTIYTDCSLTHPDNLTSPSSCHAKVQLHLVQFKGKYKIRHRSGREQIPEDFFSRDPDPVKEYDAREEERDAWALQDEELHRPDLCRGKAEKSINPLDKIDTSSETYKIISELENVANVNPGGKKLTFQNIAGVNFKFS
ncbi:LOW QUALITY PROTEIN: Retrovirus-related Pol polyprotein from transposon 412 [Frankliniella fusca]|uniref:Retrovirus-related Pol polyprotein from transposon 412 n=1 Tax=Frankliniella fusca TaxID=407009 RepID=A0AAE1GTJ8_9NEOP|nr:LOW QUALITY PROTEIN: Retrovirus-related Pol polyprotein from transposon 412 [Frankliniella fusca]